LSALSQRLSRNKKINELEILFFRFDSGATENSHNKTKQKMGERSPLLHVSEIRLSSPPPLILIS